MDSFYVIRISRTVPVRPGTPVARDIFVTETRRLGGFHKARQFESIEAAESYLATEAVPRHLRANIQCCLQKTAQQQPVSELESSLQDLMQIPHPYRRTAYNWLRGRNVKELLQRESSEVYERHHRSLLDYGIDISQKSSIALFLPRRKRIALRTGVAPENQPKQYFPLPQQKTGSKI